MLTLLREYLSDESGAAVAEIGIIASLVMLGTAAALGDLEVVLEDMLWFAGQIVEEADAAVAHAVAEAVK